LKESGVPRLPVIVGFGGINPAGRSSFNLAYRRLVQDVLPQEVRSEMLTSLATLMGLAHATEAGLQDQQGAIITPDAIKNRFQQYILDNTLIRKISPSLYDTENLPYHQRATVKAQTDAPITFKLRRKDLPEHVPPHWGLKIIDDSHVLITVTDSLDLLFPNTRSTRVRSAGQLPDGRVCGVGCAEFAGV
jgi:acetoacetyl-[acyl-carrier protein] synthase